MQRRALLGSAVVFFVATVTIGLSGRSDKPALRSHAPQQVEGIAARQPAQLNLPSQIRLVALDFQPPPIPADLAAGPPILAPEQDSFEDYPIRRFPPIEPDSDERSDSEGITSAEDVANRESDFAAETRSHETHPGAENPELIRVAEPREYRPPEYVAPPAAAPIHRLPTIGDSGTPDEAAHLPDEAVGRHSDTTTLVPAEPSSVTARVESEEQSLWQDAVHAPATDALPTIPVRLSQGITERAQSAVKRGHSLAERGAYYSARTEFIKSLRQISQSLDAQGGSNDHAQALANGLRALAEAEDFVPPGSRLEADLDVAGLIDAHQTPVMKDVPPEQITPLSALQRYYNYGQQQLALAGGREPVAAQAMFGLAKIQSVLSARGDKATAGTRAIAFHRAALSIDPDNHLVANELGVLLAQYGQLEEARQVLQLSAEVSERPEPWYNLSVVQEKLGDAQRAGETRSLSQHLAQQRESASRRQVSEEVDSRVQWIDPDEFARISPIGNEPLGPSRAQPQVAGTRPTTEPPKSKTRMGWLPWYKPKR